MSKEKIISSDYLKLKFVEALDSTSTHVAWVQRKPNSVKRGYNSSIRVLDKNTGKIKQYTSGLAKDMSPKFSPNGLKLAFLSTRSQEKPQIFVMDITGGEALQCTKNEKGVTSFEWSPDSNLIMYNSLTDITKDDDEEKDKPISEYEAELESMAKKEEERKKVDPRVLTDLVYRSGTNFRDLELFSHLYIYDLEKEKSKRVSDGEYNFGPGAWSGNATIYVITVRTKPMYTSKNATLVKFDVSQKSTGEDVLNFLSPMSLFIPPPKISENGQIMIGGVFTEGSFAAQNSKWATVNDDNTLSIINLELDRSIPYIKWLNEDSCICIVEDHGIADIRIYSLSTKQFTTVFNAKTNVTSFDAKSDNDVYFTSTDPLHPWAVWKWTSESGVELVEDPNTEYQNKVKIVEPEEFWLTNPEGVKYQGWFFSAQDQNGKKPPMILSIHGGPTVMWNNSGTMWHEWQTQVANGYSVLAMNPIGSGGYGEKFAQLINAKWGDEDARDLLLAVDHFTERVDKNRLYITGGSYAGFQTANIIAKDHRFKGACSQRGVYNVLNFWMATDIPAWATYSWNWSFDDMDYDLEHLWKHSPTGQAKNIQTPLLMIHSENDYRVQISQAEELFGALKMQGKEAVLVRYPRDGHELSRSGEPLHVIDRLDRMMDWFETYK
ncbi:MAG: Acylamino-acid-releasing enzyme [Candidatus Heimdallarchaeota archaeon LC_2]|nr:MAG: Acylamino-acid-releasing enzyme [Candidatus Heimdallarchaeota archaeon LC_2]